MVGFISHAGVEEYKEMQLSEAIFILPSKFVKNKKEALAANTQFMF